MIDMLRITVVPTASKLMWNVYMMMALFIIAYRFCIWTEDIQSKLDFNFENRNKGLIFTFWPWSLWNKIIHSKLLAHYSQWKIDEKDLFAVNKWP